MHISSVSGFHYCFLLKGSIRGASCHSAAWMWVLSHSPDDLWHNTCLCYREKLGASQRPTVPLKVLREP